MRFWSWKYGFYNSQLFSTFRGYFSTFRNFWFMGFLKKKQKWKRKFPNYRFWFEMTLEATQPPQLHPLQQKRERTSAPNVLEDKSWHWITSTPPKTAWAQGRMAYKWQGEKHRPRFQYINKRVQGHICEAPKFLLKNSKNTAGVVVFCQSENQ